MKIVYLLLCICYALGFVDYYTKEGLQDMVRVQFLSWALVAHACNPSYSGDRDQEDWGSKPDPILKKPIAKKGWWSGSRCRS
jgi:hypothetical protein